ncbi:MAG: DNA-binding protein HU-beta [Thermotogaceae bacterium]|jgi:DNA-binding protein HU-beta|nr:DNA-binding protein HU-beta [Thermotogaceae bacterium]
MNKLQLVKALAESNDTTQKQSEQFLNSLIKTIVDELSDSGEVKLVGFGTFKTKINEARKGINPQTKKEIKIPKKRVPKFVAGKDLKEKVK